MEIILTGKAEEKIREIEIKLRSYGMTEVNLNDAVGEAVLKATDEFWEKIIKQMVPPTLIIQAAAQDEDLAKLLLAVIEKQKKPRRRRRSKHAPKMSSALESQENLQSV